MLNPLDGRPGRMLPVLWFPLAVFLVCRAAPAGGQATGTADTLHVEPVPGTAGAPDTLRFEPVTPSEVEAEEERESLRHDRWERAWLQDPFHRHLLSHGRHVVYDDHGFSDFDLVLDYNRVDELRYGLSTQAQGPWTYAPRFAAQASYNTGRHDWLYLVQLEQPLDRASRFALGVSMSRATDYLDLNQVEDFENSLALLFGRQDYRDYFQREGVEGYAATRWPGITTLSAHIRSDRYRSLPALDVTSWFNTDIELRPNPAIDEGDIVAAAFRLERHAGRSGGIYHWVEYEKAGGSLGGDFDFGRVLADLRTVLHVSPDSRLTLRAVGGSEVSGDMPAQRAFTVGGVDGLRGHPFGTFRGDQVAMGQAEYSLGFGGGHGKHRVFDGVCAMVFVDTGTAWTSSDQQWDVGRQHFALDGGFGIGTDDDEMRVYFARDLRNPDADFVVTLRLQRPF